MAEVFAYVNGMKLERFIAKHETVQNELDRIAFEARVRAEAELARHHHDGHAFIETAKGDIDRYIILNDTNGQGAAMSIEYGRQPDADGKGGMEGLAILHKAVRQRLGSMRGTGGGG
jgi:hypothetical protein